jgi:hypothetical protein
MLHQYHQNHYKNANELKYIKFIYDNSYDFGAVRFNFKASIASTVLLTAALGMVSPMLCGIMLYDYYLLMSFSIQFLNRTVNNIQLSQDKQRIQVNKMNFLGFVTAKTNLF